MRNRSRPIGLLVTTLLLCLIFTHTAPAFECTNAGTGTTAPDDNGAATQTACGDAAEASNTHSTALGASALASGDRSTAVGASATASGTDATAVGLGATASAIDSTALGWGVTVSGDQSTAVGKSAAAVGDNSTALGRSARIPSEFHSNATAIGYRAEVFQSNAMVLGSIPGVNSGTHYVDVGIGTSMPQSPLHVERADGTARVQVTELDPGPSMPFQGVAQGLVRFELFNQAEDERWRFTNTGPKFAINNVSADSPGSEFNVFKNGNLTIGGALTENSDRDAKRDIVPVDRHDVLAKIARLPISEWSYIGAPGQRHIGPMAQDFHAAFGLGINDRGIATLDSSGVALAGIQALVEENRALRERVERLEAQRDEFEMLKARLEALERTARTVPVTVMN